MPALLLLLLVESAAAFGTAPWVRLTHRSTAPPTRHRAPQPACVTSPGTAAPTSAEAPPATAGDSAAAIFFREVEAKLETLLGDPQELLEAVVGLPDNVATYDRGAIVGYFTRRPTLMVGRAVEFLSAARRIRAVWLADDGARDRGSVLRAELSALGPVAVKIGQTLSQRPDILPEDVCEALKGLQTSNTPFPDAEAFLVMAEEFNATGPLAPGVAWDGCDPDAPPLFANLSSTCIASASLGQVYRATTHAGREIAVKVQRPDALRRCLLDGSVIIVALSAIQGRFWNGGARLAWPLHDIVITNIVWCKAYKERVGGRPYITQTSCNIIAVLWVMRNGRR